MTASERAHTAVIVEDDPQIRDVLVEVFEGAGFSTIWAGNGIEGVQAVLQHQPLITTLDVNMPGIDGFEAARRIRAGSDTLIIMLTGLGDEADAVMGLTSGADEFLTKPFRPRELRARIDAMVRRQRISSPATVPAPAAGPASTDARPIGSSHPAPSPRPAAASVDVLPETPARTAVPVLGDSWLAHRDLKLDPDTHIAMAGSRELGLTPTEFDLLATLLESKRRVRSKSDLTLVLRGDAYVTNSYVGDADKRAIEAHMTNLRRKLGDDAVNPRYIETVRGVGYRLTSELVAT